MVFISAATRSLTPKAKYHYSFFYGLADYIDYSFTLIEMVTFSIFFYQLITKIIVKKLIIISNIFFSLFFIYMLTIDPGFYASISETTQSRVYTAEGVILLMICLFYFIDFFKKPPNLNLNNEPVFWVSTGLLFFLTCTLPYSLLENYIRKKFPDLILTSYSIFYIFYILLFLMIIRAYLCKPEKAI